MAGFLLFFGWLGLCLWATSYVFREAPNIASQRIFYYALVWLLPFFGAAAVIALVTLGISRKTTSSSDAMFSAIVEKHRSTNSD